MRYWITDDDRPPYRPYLIVVFDFTNRRIVGQVIETGAPSPEAIFDALQQAIRKPAPGGGKGRRPELLLVETPDLAEAMSPALAQINVSCSVRELPIADELARMLNEWMDEGDEALPGLLTVAGVTPEYVAHLFSVAAEFHRAEPWRYFDGDVPIAMRLSPDVSDECFVSVLGMAGQEYGLAIYRQWQDFLRFYRQAGQSPEDLLSEQGHISVTFDFPSFLPIDDAEAAEQYGWEIAGDDAWPLFIVLRRGEGLARRPTRAELEMAEVAMLAVTRLAGDLAQGAYREDQAFTAHLTLRTFDGERAVIARYPVDDHLREAAGFDRNGNAEDEAVPLDLRSSDRFLAQILEEAGVGPYRDDPDLRRAQALIYQASEAPTSAQRIDLARKALSISPNCADAWVILAEEEADTPDRRLAYYRKGVEAGERALGRQFFRENAGDFWGILETRPYMRARFGFILTLLELDRVEEAIAECWAMLDLNPDDNQGVRYVLLRVLMDADRVDEARELIERYQGDVSVDWMYTSALLAFRSDGAGKRANKLLRQALKYNEYVPAFLAGRRRVPSQPPDYITLGGPDEAAEYVQAQRHIWQRVPGALEWLKEIASRS